jgi:hypothetical protein
VQRPSRDRCTAGDGEKSLSFYEGVRQALSGRRGRLAIQAVGGGEGGAIGNGRDESGNCRFGQSADFCFELRNNVQFLPDFTVGLFLARDLAIKPIVQGSLYFVLYSVFFHCSTA